jgi:Tfp pilus assembly protein FimT
VELIAVLVIISILAAVSLPRFTAASPFSAKGYADHVAAALRQARAVAVASQCDVQFTINAAGFTVRQRAAGAANRCATGGGFTTTVASGTAPSDIPVVATQQLVFIGGAFGDIGGPASITVHNQTITLDRSGLVQ